MSKTIIFDSWHQAAYDLRRLSEWLKPRLMAGRRIALTIGEPTRTDDQNAKLHAMLSDVAKQAEWAGNKRGITVWKRLMVASWLRAENEAVQILPALDGHGVDIIFEPTSKMSKKQVSSLLEYVYAWGAHNNIEWSNKE